MYIIRHIRCLSPYTQFTLAMRNEFNWFRLKTNFSAILLIYTDKALSQLAVISPNQLDNILDRKLLREQRFDFIGLNVFSYEQIFENYLRYDNVNNKRSKCRNVCLGRDSRHRKKISHFIGIFFSPFFNQQHIAFQLAIITTVYFNEYDQ